MNLLHLEYLLQIVKSGSITKAAQELYISQPSLTKSIKSIENEFDLKIFTRSSTGVQLTEDGKMFLYYAKNVLNAADNLEEAFREYSYQKKQLLSVACQQLDFINPVLIDLYNLYQDTTKHFNILESGRSAVVNAVINGTSDIGVFVRSNLDTKAFHNLLKDRTLELHLLDTSEVYVSMGPKSPVYDKEDIAFSDLGEELMIALDMEEDATQYLYLGKQDSYFNMQKLIFSNSIKTCMDFLLGGSVHLYTPKWVLGFFKGTAIRSRKIKTDKLEKKPLVELIYAKRKNEPLTKIEQDFVNEITQIFAKP